MHLCACALSLAGCARYGAVGGARPAPIPADTSLFAASVAFLRDGAEGRLEVDPRYLLATKALSALAPDAIEETDAAGVAARGRVLQRLGVPETDTYADQACASARGPHRAPGMESPARAADEAGRQREEACLARGRYTSAALSAPEAVTVETGGAAERVWRVRVVRLTTSSYRVIDLHLQPRGDGSWHVVREVERFGVMS